MYVAIIYGNRTIVIEEQYSIQKIEILLLKKISSPENPLKYEKVLLKLKLHEGNINCFVIAHLCMSDKQER